MLKVRYKNEINQFLLEFENWYVKANVTGIAFQKGIRDEIPDEAMRRMSMHQQYADNRDWIEALRPEVRDEDDFQEGKWFKAKNFWGSNSRGKTQGDEPTTGIKTKKPKYRAKEKRVYQAKKEEEKVDKGKAVPVQKIMHRVLADAQTCIDQEIVH